MEEVAAAEEKMTAAQDALMSYIESGKAGKTLDRDQHRKLVARLKKAQSEFMRAVADLDK